MFSVIVISKSASWFITYKGGSVKLSVEIIAKDGNCEIFQLQFQQQHMDQDIAPT